MNTEYLELYDENRNKTGKIVERGDFKLEPGEYFLVTEALLINSNNEILISKRSEEKKLYPGMWEVNGGGCRVGETSKEALVREMSEELGIKLDINKIYSLKTVRNERRFKDIWTYRLDIDISDLRFTDNEVTEAKWVTYEEFLKMKNEDILVDTSNITKEDYEKAIDLLKE